jgi:hypothetical protein
MMSLNYSWLDWFRADEYFAWQTGAVEDAHMKGNKHRAVALAVIGGFGFMYLLRAVTSGAINLGGGRSPDFLVTFRAEPLYFCIGLVLITLLSAGALYAAWRDWQSASKNDEG